MSAAVEAPRAASALEVLRDPQTMRLRCAGITAAAEQGRSAYFRVDREAIEPLALRLAASLRAAGSDPAGAGLGRLAGAGVQSRGAVDELLAPLAPASKHLAAIDLVVLGTLLGTDPGPRWRYRERTGLDALALPAQRHGSEDLLAMLDRSASTARPAAAAAEPAAAGPQAVLGGQEGLALAIRRGFKAGMFSADAADPLRVDAAALRQIDAAALRALFQASGDNPLAGLEGRAGLLARLGIALEAQAVRDGQPPRPAALLEFAHGGGTRQRLPAAELLAQVHQRFGSVWHTGGTVVGQRVGDCWPHRWAGAAAPEHYGAARGASDGWVPLHGMALALTRALVPPLAAAGVQVHGLEVLPGLADAPHGTLLIAAGVIAPRAPLDLARRWKVGDEIVVEWRALTVTLLDALALRVAALVDDLPHGQAPLELVDAAMEGSVASKAERTATVQVDGDGCVL
jgi:hypothetical protein